MKNENMPPENRLPDSHKGDLPAGLSNPARRALSGAGITRLEQLAAFTEADVKHLHGIGTNALAKLRQALSEKGLSLASPKNLSEK